MTLIDRYETHRRTALALLPDAPERMPAADRIAVAQVYATLALAAATRDTGEALVETQPIAFQLVERPATEPARTRPVGTLDRDPARPAGGCCGGAAAP